jgi:hypothetical protein
MRLVPIRRGCIEERLREACINQPCSIEVTTSEVRCREVHIAEISLSQIRTLSSDATYSRSISLHHDAPESLGPFVD